MTHKINMPSNLNFAGGNRAVAKLETLPPADRYILDFSDLRWVEPFPMLQVVSAVQRAISDHPGSKFEARGLTHSYARYMGFFRELGSSVGPERGRVPNHENYLPINALDLSALRGEAGQRGVAVGQIVERHAGQIAKTLVRKDHGPLWETLQYAIREMIRNAAEHSESNRLLYCGQYWPERAKVEIALLDEGIGIAQSLRANPHVKAKTDIEALRLSVLPGISGAAYEGSAQAGDDKWANSGFGLYVVSELCRRGGDFTVASGNGALQLCGKEYSNLKSIHSGTGVRLVLETENLRSIAAALSLIVHKGERIAREILKLPSVEASTASKMGWLS